MVEFYVYENWVRSKAITHRATCPYCKDGNGLHGTRTTKSSTWHGPYATVEQARETARSCHRDRTDDCKFCCP
jgi:hypothetical protein